MSIFDDAELKAWLEEMEERNFPAIRKAAFSVALLGEPSPSLCLQFGAMVLLDKPIIVLKRPNQAIPTNVKRVASAIVEGDPLDPGTQERLRQAILNLIKTDARMPKSS
jgi:hypothetical protein